MPSSKNSTDFKDDNDNYVDSYPNELMDVPPKPEFSGYVNNKFKIQVLGILNILKQLSISSKQMSEPITLDEIPYNELDIPSNLHDVKGMIDSNTLSSGDLYAENF